MGQVTVYNTSREVISSRAVICPQNNTVPLPQNTLQPLTEHTVAAVRSSCLLCPKPPSTTQLPQQLVGRNYSTCTIGPPAKVSDKAGNVNMTRS